MVTLGGMADPKRPSPRERVDRAVAAARPAVEKARAKAEPQVEKAAKKAGGLFGQLRDRAKETAKGFGDGYKSDGSGPESPAVEDTDRRPKPGPR